MALSQTVDCEYSSFSEGSALELLAPFVHARGHYRLSCVSLDGLSQKRDYSWSKKDGLHLLISLLSLMALFQAKLLKPLHTWCTYINDVYQFPV